MDRKEGKEGKEGRKDKERSKDPKKKGQEETIIKY